MYSLYLVHWGPAVGDDFSIQAFTTKEPMNAFVKEIMQRKAADMPDLAFEVHFLDGSNINVAPNLDDEDVSDDASDLIAFNSGNEIIWRNNTERHQEV